MTGISRVVLEPISRRARRIKTGSIPAPQLPDVRPSMALRKIRAGMPRGSRCHERPTAPPSQTWGLLLPICSRGKGEVECWKDLRSFRDSILDTVVEENRPLIKILSENVSLNAPPV